MFDAGASWVLDLHGGRVGGSLGGLDGGTSCVTISYLGLASVYSPPM